MPETSLLPMASDMSTPLGTSVMYARNLWEGYYEELLNQVGIVVGHDDVYYWVHFDDPVSLGEDLAFFPGELSIVHRPCDGVVQARERRRLEDNAGT